jgi:hypothetical protein
MTPLYQTHSTVSKIGQICYYVVDFLDVKIRMNDTPFQELPTYTQKSVNKGRLFILLFLILLVIIVVLAGAYFYFVKGDRPVSTTVPVPAHNAKPTAVKLSVTPSASPSANLSRSSLTLSVLNGSGVPGAAKQIATGLTNLGYDVTMTDNANNFNYKNVTIEIQSGKSDYLPLLKSDVLKSTSQSVSSTIDNSISTDAVVIVGK